MIRLHRFVSQWNNVIKIQKQIAFLSLLSAWGTGNTTVRLFRIEPKWLGLRPNLKAKAPKSYKSHYNCKYVERDFCHVWYVCTEPSESVFLSIANQVFFFPFFPPSFPDIWLGITMVGLNLDRFRKNNDFPLSGYHQKRKEKEKEERFGLSIPVWGNFSILIIRHIFIGWCFQLWSNFVVWK